MSEIGKLIQELRHEEKIKQEELARKINLGGNTARNNLVILERIEDGRSFPSEQQIWNLARFFNSNKLLDKYFETLNAKDELQEYVLDKRESKEKDRHYFVDRLNELIEKDGGSIEEIANGIGIPRASLDKYKTHKSYGYFPGNKNMKLICDYFDVTPDHFYPATSKNAVKKMDGYYQINGDRYYSARQLWERWQMPMNAVSPYISELKRDGNIRAIKFKNKNLVHESELDRVYKEIPDKHKTEYSTHQLELMTHRVDTTETSTQLTIEELNQKIKKLNKKVDQLEEKVNNRRGLWSRLFNWGGDN
jgi:transcriptional regulator with XRE-family HTH domain